MLTDFSQNYYRDLNTRLPKQLQDFEYYLLPTKVDAIFNKELQKYKPEKKPLLFKSKDIPKEDFTRYYIENLRKQLSQKSFENERISFNQNRLNIGINLELSDILIIDIDNASTTLQKLNAISKFLTGSKKELLQKFYASLSNTFTVKSGNNGFHHYFKFDKKNNTIKKSVKSFALHKLLSQDDLKIINSSLPKGYEIGNKLDLDILTKKGYCICPPSRFNFFDPHQKIELENEYTVFKDLPILEIDENLILELFVFEEEEEINSNIKIFKALDTQDEIENNYSKYLRMVENYDFITIFNDPFILEDREIRILKRKLEIKNYDKNLIRYLLKIRIKELINREYFDRNGYAFMLQNIQNDYRAMNLYAKNKRGNLEYHFLSNIFKSLISKNYDKQDRSGFEYAFLVSQIATGMNPYILYEYVKRYFSPNAKLKSKSYFFQAYTKAVASNSQIQSDNPFIPIALFLKEARKIDYKYYFGKSSHSCTSVFLTLIERKMKIANDQNNLWRLTHESFNNLSLLCKMDPKTVKSSLDKLASEDFIFFNTVYKPTKEGKTKKEKEREKYFTIQINHEKKFKTSDVDYYISDALPELIYINSIGRIGSQIYSRILLEGGKTAKEIYKLFPGIKNPYGTVKNKIQKLLNLGLLEYFEEDKMYFPSIQNLYTKIEKAKRTELCEKKIKMRKKIEANKKNLIAIRSLEFVPNEKKKYIEQMTKLKPRKYFRLKPISLSLDKSMDLIQKRNKFHKIKNRRNTSSTANYENDDQSENPTN